MTLRELSEWLGTSFDKVGYWVSDFFCKIGFSGSLRCHSTDWRDLTLGQVSLIAVLIYVFIRYIFDAAKAMGASGVKAFPFSVLVFIGTAWIELTLADSPHINIHNHIPWFPFGLLLVFFLLLLPFFVAFAAYAFLVIYFEKETRDQ